MFGPPERRDPATDWSEKLAPLAPHSLKVLLDVSNKCNLRCRMCHFSYDTVFYRPTQYMTPNAFAQIAAKVFPYAREAVLSAGSEPLTSPHFRDILEIAGRFRLPELKFLTNAQLLTPEIAEAVIVNGVTQIDISIDGATKATYEHIRRGGSFDRLKANLAHLTARKRELGVTTPLLQFNLTLMRANLGELEAFVDLAEELGVARIGARHLMPYEGLGMDQESLSLVPDEADAAFRRFLDRAARSAVKVINFPDFFSPEPEATPAPQAPAAMGAVAPDAATFAPAATRNTLPLAAHVDQPAVPEVEAGDILLLHGWAVDGGGHPRVVIERDALATDPPESIQPNWRVRLGEARFVNGSRFDIAELFPDHPGNNASAWSFEVRRQAIWSAPAFTTRIHVTAEGAGGARQPLGTYQVAFSASDEVAPFVFCGKPFEAVFIDVNGDVNPYADCRPDGPYGNLLVDGSTFEDIWFGDEYRSLREAIIRRNPPAMCLTCPNFINRNVDDAAYFEARTIETGYRRPIGRIDDGAPPRALPDGAIEIAGWTLAFDPISRVEIWAREGDAVEGATGQRLGEVVFHEGPVSGAPAQSAFRRYANRDRCQWTFRIGRDLLRALGPTPRLEAVAHVEGGELPTPVGALRLPSRRTLAVPFDGFVQRVRGAARS